MPDGSQVPLNPATILDRPAPGAAERSAVADAIRADAANLHRPAVTTTTNGEETAYDGVWPTQFTKGLQHDDYGMLKTPDDYRGWVTAINERPEVGKGLFDVQTADPTTYTTRGPDGSGFAFRGWESPRAGHAFDLSGPDGDEVGMAAAPRLGASELTAEMAEVYGLALLRDVPFTKITSASTVADPGHVSPREVIGALNALPYFTGTPTDLDSHAMRRQKARLAVGETMLTGASVFRGSTAGAKTGPYLSQFMLVGGKDHPASGCIPYGAQQIDQRVATFTPDLDYMGDWASWLDVQNGANTRRVQKPDGPRRFLTTPRDLASYVRIDALYQAYLNAALILIDHGAPFDPGFPSSGRTRTGFATFGVPDLLAVLTAVSSVALKAVRRQKFNFHRRCRPERIGGLLTLAANGEGARLGAAEPAASRMLSALGATDMLDWIAAHNQRSLEQDTNPVQCRDNPDGFARSYLLPMAFAEGSPMHAAYGAGHATVAGACVTVLKAFFDTFTTAQGWDDKLLSALQMTSVFEPTEDGMALCPVDCDPLTLTGELDKLAANISIGRNMAGVHFYTDYFDSLRMGERIAVGMLEERLLSYQEPVSMRLRSFDGDRMTLQSHWSANGRLRTEVTVEGASFAQWWTRHVPAASS
jgi:hypothetical protein